MPGARRGAGIQERRKRADFRKSARERWPVGRRPLVEGDGRATPYRGRKPEKAYGGPGAGDRVLVPVLSRQVLLGQQFEDRCVALVSRASSSGSSTRLRLRVSVGLLL